MPATRSNTTTWEDWLYTGLLIITLILLLSSILYAFWWMPRELYRRISEQHEASSHLYVRAIPFAGSIFFFLTAFLLLLVASNPDTAHQRTMPAVAFTLSTLVFAALSAASLVVSIRSFWRPVSPPIRWHSLLTSIALMGATLFLAYTGVLGLRTWRW